MTRVFVIENDAKLDINLASRHGQVVELFPHDRYRPSVFEPAFGEAVLQKLDEHSYDPDDDFILICGKMIPMCAAMAAIGAAYEKFNTLCFNAQSSVRDYVPMLMGDLAAPAV